MNDTLFVYGSLQYQTADKQLNRLLQQKCRRLSGAYTYGRLYHLGDFPALTLVAGGKVFGQLFRLRWPERLFPYLDRYEGEAYRRQEIIAYDMLRHRPHQVWAYIYCRPLGQYPRVKNGLFSKKSKKSKPHSLTQARGKR